VLREDLEKTIRKSMQDVAEMNSQTLVNPIVNDTVLLESGLDSLSFAGLVATLEFTLDYDPFSDVETAYYPTTFLEFVDFYYANQPK